jgi:hypothetical protein
MNATAQMEIIDAPPRALAVTTPSDLLAMAVQQGADLDKLERLMALQERWEAAQAKRAYNEAFSAFKAEAVRIFKNKGFTDGPLKGKRYAELFAVVNAVTPALSANGLSAAWSVTKDDKDWIEVTCTLKHVGGHTESVSMGGPPDASGAKNAMQARASTVSYLERYTLKAITGLSEQGDDDNGGRGQEEVGENPLLEDGQAAAMEGMKSLTAWWGSLTAKDRAGLNKQYPSLRRAAEAADADR